MCKVPCRDGEACYVGETRRSLWKTITEHKYAVKNNDRKNGIAVHAWDAAEVAETEPQYILEEACLLLEAIWIQKTSQTCNLDCGLTLSEAWPYILDKTPPSHLILYFTVMINHRDQLCCLFTPVMHVLLLLQKVPKMETFKFYDKVCYAKLYLRLNDVGICY